MVLFFSPYEDVDEEYLTELILDRCKKFGRIDKNSELKLSSIPILFFSIGGSDSFLTVIDYVKMLRNESQLACEIWKVNYVKKNLPYPQVEGGKIIFKKLSDETKVLETEEGIIQELFSDFVREYQKDNPNSKKPVFYFSSSGNEFYRNFPAQPSLERKVE